MIKYRAERLVEKLLSFKFVIFVITTVLKCFDIIGGGEWLTVTSIVLCGHEGQKGISKFMDRSKLQDEKTLGSN